MSSKIQADLLRFVATIPATENPYYALERFTKDQFLPTVAHATIVQLYCLAAILAATFILVLVSIGIRINKRIFWLYSVSHSPAFLIKPHFSLPWSIVAAVMLVLYEFFIARCVSLFKQDIKSDMGYWVFLSWAAAWVGGAFAAHALGTNFLITSCPADQRRWSIVANLAGILSPIIYLSYIVPVGVLGGKRFADMVTTYNQFESLLNRLGEEWVEGESINLIKLSPALPLVQVVTDQQRRFFASWKQVFIFYAISAVVLVSVLITIALGFLSSLRKTIKESQAVLTSDGAAGFARHQVHRTWQTLVMTIVAFVLLGSIFFGTSLYAALNPSSLEHAVQAQVTVLVPLYAFALLGLPTSALLVWRAAESAPRDAASGPSQVRRSTLSKSGSRELDAEVRKYSIELGGRTSKRAREGRRDLDVRFDGSAVSVTVEVETKEEAGEFDDDLVQDEKNVAPPNSSSAYR